MLGNGADFPDIDWCSLHPKGTNQHRDGSVPYWPGAAQLEAGGNRSVGLQWTLPLTRATPSARAYVYARRLKTGNCHSPCYFPRSGADVGEVSSPQTNTVSPRTLFRKNAELPKLCATLSTSLAKPTGTTSRYVWSQFGCRSLSHFRAMPRMPDGDPIPGFKRSFPSPGPC